MNKPQNIKARILSVLEKDEKVSARVIANKVKKDFQPVAYALAEMIADGTVKAEETGRKWGGVTVHVFSLRERSTTPQSNAWEKLLSAINDKKQEAAS